jgi:hypothetical protein
MDIEDKAENLNLKEAEQLKEIINNSTDKLMQNLSNIFSATKFESNNRTGNIELNENMDSMANEINTLLNVVHKLKIRELKMINYKRENIDPIFIGEQENARLKNDIFKNNCKKLEDLYQNINNTLNDMKKSEFYVMCKKICE